MKVSVQKLINALSRAWNAVSTGCQSLYNRLVKLAASAKRRTNNTDAQIRPETSKSLFERETKTETTSPKKHIHISGESIPEGGFYAVSNKLELGDKLPEAVARTLEGKGYKHLYNPFPGGDCGIMALSLLMLADAKDGNPTAIELDPKQQSNIKFGENPLDSEMIKKGISKLASYITSEDVSIEAFISDMAGDLKTQPEVYKSIIAGLRQIIINELKENSGNELFDMNLDNAKDRMLNEIAHFTRDIDAQALKIFIDKLGLHADIAEVTDSDNLRVLGASDELTQPYILLLHKRHFVLVSKNDLDPNVV